jgi:hypothetical protein
LAVSTRQGHAVRCRSIPKEEVHIRPSFRALAILAAVYFLWFGGIGFAGALDAVHYKGSWYLEMDDREQPALRYLHDEKIVFFIGVGRAVGLWIAYPGPPQPDGKAKITIRTSSRVWRMNGELTNDHNALAHPDERATYFLQWDMGLSRPKPEFGSLTRLHNQFIDSLVSSKQIVVVTKNGNFTLPRIDVKDARKRMRI